MSLPVLKGNWRRKPSNAASFEGELEVIGLLIGQF